jgi:hypothetical protein
MVAPQSPSDRPIGVLIRRKRRSLKWTIDTLVHRYLYTIVRQETESGKSLDWDNHPLALNAKDIGRLERGESVRITIAKLRILCETLQFSEEETARILARAHRESLMDLDEDMTRVMEALYLAATALVINPQSKGSISEQIGERKIDDVPQREVLNIVYNAISEIIAPRRRSTQPSPEIKPTLTQASLVAPEVDRDDSSQTQTSQMSSEDS